MSGTILDGLALIDTTGRLILAATDRSDEPNVQALIEKAFHAELAPLLRAERFVRAATGLVLILGLLGTFYGLTMSVGKLVHLLAADTNVIGDVSHAVTQGLTDSLSGMAVAFSNSLLGVGSAVTLTILGVLNNVTDLRTALMVRIETYLDRWLPKPRTAAGGGGFDASVARLEAVVSRVESAMQQFAARTRDLREIQLVVALKPSDGR